jgi:hypothetical protein
MDAKNSLEDRTVVCSGKGCHENATYALLWNNPKVHTPERRKTWLTCDEHLQWLAHFLSMRGFLKDTVEVGQLTEEMG